MRRLGCEAGSDPFFGDAVFSRQEWHFTGNSTGREGWQTATAAGGAVSFIAPPATMPGAVRVAVTDLVGATDEASFCRVLGGRITFDTGTPRSRFRRIIRLLNAPDAVDDFAFRIGYANGFQYDGSSEFFGLSCDFGAFGANWQLDIDNGTTTDTVDTGIAVSSLLTNPIAVEFRVLEDAAHIALDLNGVTVAESTDLAGASNLQAVFQAVKRVGTTQRILDCDYASEDFQLPGAFA